MRHPSTLAVYAHWSDLGGTPAVRRPDLKPAAMREALADAFILERQDEGGMAFALAGTRVCAALGGELRGKRFTERFADPAAAADVVSRLFRGEVLAGTLLAHSPDGSAFRFEFSLMPLSHRGIQSSAAIGTMAPISPRVWAGQPLGLPAIEGMRSVRGAAVPPEAKTPDARRAALRLVVGGKPSLGG